MAFIAPFRRITRAVVRYGLTGLGYRMYAVFVDRWFDLRYGTDTCAIVPLDKLHITGRNESHGYRYEPARTAPVRELFRETKSLLPGGQKLVDLGSGKGRVLLIAAEQGAARATGVEFAAELCETARANCARYRQRTGVATEFEVIESDVVEYEIRPDDNLFSFFNPFDQVVLERVLQNITTSYRRNARPIILCFYNTPLSSFLDTQPAFREISRREYWGYQFALFRLVE